MSPADIKEFYNGQFFDEDSRPKEALLMLTFETAEGKTIRLPGVRLRAGHTIGEIFHAFHEYLLKEATTPAGELVPNAPPPNGQATDADTVLDIEVITYRDNEYFVELRKDGRYIVRKKETNEVIDERSPTARGAVKVYRETYGVG